MSNVEYTGKRFLNVRLLWLTSLAILSIETLIEITQPRVQEKNEFAYREKSKQIGLCGILRSKSLKSEATILIFQQRKCF